MIELTDQAFREICPAAKFKLRPRGPAVFCEDAIGKNAPNRKEFAEVNERGVCICTEFYSIEHGDYGSTIYIDKIRQCQNNKNNSK